jgi:hypothetical protein
MLSLAALLAACALVSCAGDPRPTFPGNLSLLDEIPASNAGSHQRLSLARSNEKLAPPQQDTLSPYPAHHHGPRRRSLNASIYTSVRAAKRTSNKYFETRRFDYWNSVGHVTRVFDPVSLSPRVHSPFLHQITHVEYPVCC